MHVLERERLYAEAETRLGRKLHAGERVIDIKGIDAALEDAKAELTGAIDAEIRRTLKLRRRGSPAVPTFTTEMLAPLVSLYEQGQEHAHREIRDLGLTPVKHFASALDRLPGPLRRLRAFFHSFLTAIGVRITQETAKLRVASPGPLTDEFLAKLEERIPGARDLASRVVSTAFDAGLADVYEQNKELFPCWLYSAIMDSATCGPCRKLDGTRYDTWEEIMAVLPDGGPNPLCRGDGRCRCRAVPCPPDA